MSLGDNAGELAALGQEVKDFASGRMAGMKEKAEAAVTETQSVKQAMIDLLGRVTALSQAYLDHGTEQWRVNSDIGSQAIQLDILTGDSNNQAVNNAKGALSSQRVKLSESVKESAYHQPIEGVKALLQQAIDQMDPITEIGQGIVQVDAEATADVSWAGQEIETASQQR